MREVLLVEGNGHISGVIKYLPQSTWSHAALYVGFPRTAAQGMSKVDSNADSIAAPCTGPISLCAEVAPLSCWQCHRTLATRAALSLFCRFKRIIERVSGGLTWP
jgi:hypothetical protein